VRNAAPRTRSRTRRRAFPSLARSAGSLRITPLQLQDVLQMPADALIKRLALLARKLDHLRSASSTHSLKLVVNSIFGSEHKPKGF
jgi:hypothetical protein